MSRISKEEYLADPCSASSLPFWKTEQFAVPENVSVFRDDEFDKEKCPGTDERYFKLIHDLRSIPRPVLPKGYELTLQARKNWRSTSTRATRKSASRRKNLRDMPARKHMMRNCGSRYVSGQRGRSPRAASGRSTPGSGKGSLTGSRFRLPAGAGDLDGSLSANCSAAFPGRRILQRSPAVWIMIRIRLPYTFPAVSSIRSFGMSSERKTCVHPLCPDGHEKKTAMPSFFHA